MMVIPRSKAKRDPMAFCYQPANSIISFVHNAGRMIYQHKCNQPTGNIHRCRCQPIQVLLPPRFALRNQDDNFYLQTLQAKTLSGVPFLWFCFFPPKADAVSKQKNEQKPNYAPIPGPQQRIYNLYFSFYNLDFDIRYAILGVRCIGNFRLHKNSINSKV